MVQDIYSSNTGCECNFCHEFYNIDEGVFLYKKYFVCDYCFNTMELFLELQYTKNPEELTDLSQWLIETDVEKGDLLPKGATLEQKPTKETCLINKPPQCNSPTEKQKAPQKEKPKIPFPIELKSMLDEHVISQDEAKKTLSIAVYNHYMRLNNVADELPKSNIIFVGDSGTGKTFMVQTIAKLINVPLYIADSPSYTQTGWKGNDVNDILVSLITAANGNLDLAERGIVYLDEIDKMCIKSTNGNGGDINGKGVQQSLLKMVEGAKITVAIGNKTIELDTSNILFIGGGVFEGLDGIISKRLGEQSTGMGFGSTPKQKVIVDRTKVTHEDLAKFGFMPEFVGRFAVISVLEKLYLKDLVKILVEPKNSIVSQYKKLFSLSGIELDFEKQVLSDIAEQAMKRGIGARGLKSILESLIKEAMFELPGSGIKKYKVKLKKEKKACE
jgi:ATP-dependent Clp protease ATP-binding subunit ClpX